MGSYTFSLVSDLHLDIGAQPRVEGLGENVIVAGDTSNGLGGVKFLNKLKRNGHFVFAVDGNHEHYANLSRKRSLFETELAFYELLDQPQAVQITDGLTIIGCNGWYHIADEFVWKARMNDWHAGSAPEINNRAASHANFLARELEALDGKAIVVTHAAPTQETLDPRYAGHWSNDWYWNPWLGDVMRRHADKIACHCHGHTHASCDKIIDGVRIVVNPRGYPGENTGWAPKEVTVEW